MTTTPEQAVTQADRDCAENAIRAWVLMGANDDAWPAILAQAFATYRLDVTNPADCGCGMGVLCFRDRREPALDKIAFAIIEGSAGLRAAEHAKEFQTGNWRDALRSAQAVSRLAHSQPASEGLREALEYIASRKPYPELDDGDPGHRCAHCAYRWKDSEVERHANHCAYVLAVAALQPLTEPQRLGREGEIGGTDLRTLIASAKGHLANVRAHGNAEANACLVIERALDAALSTPAQAEPVANDELARGKDELRRLMDVIWRSEFRTEAPNWKPLDDLPGMVSQIDNMYAGVRAQRDQARWDLHNPPAPLQDREAVVVAATALLSKLDDALPHISNAILIATNHHCPYEGPQIDGEMETLRAALPLLAEDRGERS